MTNDQDYEVKVTANDVLSRMWWKIRKNDFKSVYHPLFKLGKVNCDADSKFRVFMKYI